MNHSEIWTAIEKFASEHHLTCSGLARKSGLDATTFNRSKRFSRNGQERWPSTQSIAKILNYSGLPIEEFTKHIHSNGSELHNER
jgi:phage repressor protein C with HTH and peptisase S24 domain